MYSMSVFWQPPQALRVNICLRSSRSSWKSCVEYVGARKIGAAPSYMMTPPHAPVGTPENLLGGQSLWWKARVVFGLLLLATLIVVLTHMDEERRFLALLTHLTPTWFLVAVG